MKNLKTINLNGTTYNVGFSSNDFTDALKDKLNNLSENSGGGDSNTTFKYENEVLYITTTGGSNTGGSNPGESDGDEIEQVFIGTSVNDNAMGSVTGMGTYNKGESVTLIANANEGYRFVSWGDEETDNPRTVTADVNGVTYSAIFEAI
jgi:hypothetical protein